jgi:hypothetical protein
MEGHYRSLLPGYRGQEYVPFQVGDVMQRAVNRALQESRNMGGGVPYQNPHQGVVPWNAAGGAGENRDELSGFHEAAMCLEAMKRGEDVAAERAQTIKKPRKRKPAVKVEDGTGDAVSHAAVGDAPRAEAGDDTDDQPKRQKSCKYVGVRKRKWGTYAAEIRNPITGSREWLGTFDTAEEAAVVYDVRLRMIRGVNSTRANFPPLEPHTTMLSRTISPHGASRPEREQIEIPGNWLDQILQYRAKLERLEEME